MSERPKNAWVVLTKNETVGKDTVWRVAQVPGKKGEFSCERWVPRVPRIWAPGISIRCKRELQFECWIHL
jgi:hypothetical protein